MKGGTAVLKIVCLLRQSVLASALKSEGTLDLTGTDLNEIFNIAPFVKFVSSIVFAIKK